MNQYNLTVEVSRARRVETCAVQDPVNELRCSLEPGHSGTDHDLVPESEIPTTEGTEVMARVGATVEADTFAEALTEIGQEITRQWEKVTSMAGAVEA